MILLFFEVTRVLGGLANGAFMPADRFHPLLSMSVISDLAKNLKLFLHKADKMQFNFSEADVPLFYNGLLVFGFSIS